MYTAVLFIFGLAVGSFMNVLALRYREDRMIFDPSIIGGRSHCLHCKNTLRWFELIPVLSFAVQRGRCRRCGAGIKFVYPLVELISGFIFAFVPMQFGGDPLQSTIWVASLEILLLISYIDIRLQIVPDELNVILGILAIFGGIFIAAQSGQGNVSFFYPYANLMGLQDSFWLSHIAGAFFGAGFFALLIAVTRGKGMGWGDVKLGFPLGLLFGWPDILFLYGIAFIAGAIVGCIVLFRHGKSMKSALPFVPFMAFAAAIVLFFGKAIVGWYIHTVVI